MFMIGFIAGVLVTGILATSIFLIFSTRQD